ncbi:hypothetical protein HU200_029358 [Digitaria exilis]|uniref:Uncharacterized protein n=1 Tax=Digitaria exilis TaxID=1010633 RepID=A0A835ET94_9POAL|nr:hypothetical protein HU200_029358 [Digitaria exilis]
MQRVYYKASRSLSTISTNPGRSLLQECERGSWEGYGLHL